MRCDWETKMPLGEWSKRRSSAGAADEPMNMVPAAGVAVLISTSKLCIISAMMKGSGKGCGSLWRLQRALRSS